MLSPPIPPSTRSRANRQLKAAPAPAPAKTPAGSVAFSPALAQQLEDALGSAQRVDQLLKRTELFARGGISAQNYWSTLKDVRVCWSFFALSSSGFSLDGFAWLARLEVGAACCVLCSLVLVVPGHKACALCPFAQSFSGASRPSPVSVAGPPITSVSL